MRFDPTGHLEALGEMRIRHDCSFSFTGSDVTEDDSQGKLEV